MSKTKTISKGEPMKQWYLSKTIWVNLLTMVIGGVTAMSQSSVVAEHPALTAAVAAIIGGVNVLLRFVTDSPVAKLFLKETVKTDEDIIDSIPKENRHLNVTINK